MIMMRAYNRAHTVEYLRSPANSCGTLSPNSVKIHGAGGQAMVEYMIIAGMLIAAVAILAVFLYTFKEHGGRVLDLAASEYP